MTLPAHLCPLPRLGGHGGAALAAEVVGTAEGGELPGAPGEAKTLFVPRHHQLAQPRQRGDLGIRSQIQQQAGQSVPLVESLEMGGVQMGGQAGLGALGDLPPFIQQDEVIAPQHEPAGLFG
ncbi:hypothetical protein D3C85_1322530 [compost metagenome]